MSETLNSDIAKFYDVSSRIWEKTWGEHMHHGFYGRNSKKKNNRQAQVDLIEELLKWGRVERAASIFDVGCGIGGSSIYLAKKFGASVKGITLSPVQANRANELAAKENLSKKVVVEIADILSFRNKESFDLIWALESAEHIPDKKKFLQICFDLLSPGGKLLMATWCHRAAPPTLSADEILFLKKLYSAYHLPNIISINEFEQLANSVGFHETEITDWTEEVAPFWNAVKKSVLNFKTLAGMLQAGLPTIRGAMAMNLMIKGYRNGLLRFGVMKAVKP